MNDVIINALLARIKSGQMEVDQAPVPMQDVIQMMLETPQ